jgi:hypothetical protein
VLLSSKSLLRNSALAPLSERGFSEDSQHPYADTIVPSYTEKFIVCVKSRSCFGISIGFLRRKKLINLYLSLLLLNLSHIPNLSLPRELREQVGTNKNHCTKE